MTDPKQTLKQLMAKRLSAKRFEHSLRVADLAAKMAERHGACAEKAWITGLIHDYARELPPEQLKSLAHKIGQEDEISLSQHELLHAPVGAHLIQVELGIVDREIVNAVASHTVGRRKMSKLEQIIYLADLLEPGRSFPGVDELRQMASENLSNCLLEALNHSIRYLLDKGKPIHVMTMEARNHLLIGGNNY